MDRVTPYLNVLEQNPDVLDSKVLDVPDVGQPSVSDTAPGFKQAPFWPGPPDEAAQHGVIGDIVRAIEPHTESDPLAILIQCLCAFGSCAGRNAYYQVEAERHYPNLFTVLVGDTAKGRKGTSKGHVMRLFSAVEETWANDCVQSGLTSGEGLISAVRDPVEKHTPITEKGRVIDYQDVVIDPGVEDKRLLVVESEFASTLRVLGRDGNTLSPCIRNAWDGAQLRTLTKNSPMKATNAHISIIGHITRDELRRYLDSTEAGNGLANRFLWVCVRRSKFLPEGGMIQEEEFTPILRRLSKAVDFARQTDRVQFDEAAREKWHAVYHDLSTGHAGLFGAVTSRAEAQVMRLATIYALLDCSDVIRLEHLEAGVAVWEYAEESARYIFGDARGDPVADEILTALRRSQDGLTRTQISALFNRNQNAGQISRALSGLFKDGLVRMENEETNGRTAERWFSVKQEA